MTLTAAELVATLRAKGAALRVVDDELDWPGSVDGDTAAAIMANAEVIRRYLIAERFQRLQEFGPSEPRKLDRAHLEFWRGLFRNGSVRD